jgi:acyl dehydratase
MKFDSAAAPMDVWIAEFTTEPVTHEILMQYAQVSGDLNPLHIQPDFARKAGFEDVIVHGMYGMAQLGRLLTRHFRPESIRSFRVRFGAVIPVGSRIHCRAKLIARTHQTATLALEASPATQGAASPAITGTADIALHE